MSPLEKKDRRLREGKRISKKKISTRTMIKQAVRGRKIDFHLRGKKKTFIVLPKIQPSPFSFLMVHPLYRPCNGIWNLGKNLHVESGILGFGVQSTDQRIRTPTSNWNWESKFHWQRLESSTCNPESVTWNPESQTIVDSLTWGDL